MKKINLETVVLLLACILSLLVAIFKIGKINFESVISLISSIIFGILFFRKFNKKSET